MHGRVFGTAVDRVPVLYIDHENSAFGLRRRLEAMGVHGRDVAAEGLHYSLLEAWAPLDTETGGRQLLDAARSVGARFVVLDTASKVISGPENDNDTWNALYRHTLLPLKGDGITSLTLDHTGKDAAKGPRGASTKPQNVDTVWWISDAPVAGGSGPLCLQNRKDREGMFDRTVWLDRIDEPGRPLTHEPASTTEILARTAAGDDGLHDVVLDIARASGKPFTQRAMERAVLESEVAAGVARIRKVFKALKADGLLAEDGQYIEQ